VRESGKLGLILMGLWLILTGLIEVTGVAFAASDTVLQILALVAGVSILVDWLRLGSVMQPTRALGMSLLGAWLILSSLLPLLELADVSTMNTIWALLAILVGLILLLG
jgi:hypothetical protein